MASYDYHPLIVGVTSLAVVVITIVILMCLCIGIKLCHPSNTEETRDLICHNKTFAVTTSFVTSTHGTAGSSHPLSQPGPNSGTSVGGRIPRLGTPGDITDLPSYGAVLASCQATPPTSMAPPLYSTVVNEECERRPVSRSMLRVTDEVPPPPYPGTEPLS
ncbi:unnamed protein product [Lymnaea stagnalis]|uniref:Uncharacterized protein n=1 Tax=Lymnaea stagnalis TaxID=6523 RepID=A0AAV2IF77_LYMST